MHAKSVVEKGKVNKTSSECARNRFGRCRNDQSNNPECIRTCDLPFRPVLTPETNTVGTRAATAVFVVQLYETGSEGGPTLLNGLVVNPLIVSKLLSDRIVGTVPKTVCLWLPIRGRFEHVMGSGNLTTQYNSVPPLACEPQIGDIPGDPTSSARPFANSTHGRPYSGQAAQSRTQ